MINFLTILEKYDFDCNNTIYFYIPKIKRKNKKEKRKIEKVIHI
jgi:hypothetical protein